MYGAARIKFRLYFVEYLARDVAAFVRHSVEDICGRYMEKQFAHIRVFFVVIDIVLQRSPDKMKEHSHYAVFFMGS